MCTIREKTVFSQAKLENFVLSIGSTKWLNVKIAAYFDLLLVDNQDMHKKDGKITIY
jgi:hypothetical protein